MKNNKTDNDEFVFKRYAKKEDIDADCNSESLNPWFMFFNLAASFSKHVAMFWFIAESWLLVAVPIFGVTAISFWKAWALVVFTRGFYYIAYPPEVETKIPAKLNKMAKNQIAYDVTIIFVWVFMIYIGLPWLMS